MRVSVAGHDRRRARAVRIDGRARVRAKYGDEDLMRKLIAMCRARLPGDEHAQGRGRAFSASREDKMSARGLATVAIVLACGRGVVARPHGHSARGVAAGMLGTVHARRSSVEEIVDDAEGWQHDGRQPDRSATASWQRTR